MGDNDKDKPQEPLKKERPTKLEIIITRNLENGQLSVQGPGDGQMYDKYICFGLMEDGKDFIKAHNARAVKSAIFTPFGKKKNKNTPGAFGGGRF